MSRRPALLALLLAALSMPVSISVLAQPSIDDLKSRSDAGDKAEATNVLNDLRRSVHDRFVSPGHFAIILVGLGKLDEALGELAQAEEERWFFAGYLKIDPYFDPVRSDPRFKTLLKKMGLDQ
jgi:hypothetical protein